MSTDMLVFDPEERDPGDDLRLHFEALARVGPEERSLVKTVDARWMGNRESSDSDHAPSHVAHRWGRPAPVGSLVVQTAVAIGLLAIVLAFAMARPARLPEAVVAVPAAVVAALIGLVSWPDVWSELSALGPTVGFLAAILVLFHLSDAEGVFTYLGGVAARVSHASPQRLLSVVFVLAATVTAALSLDATIVLLTPVVFATAAKLGVRARPHVYACTHLANSASLLLPVSNLTNLLAFAASGLTFVGFARLMAQSRSASPPAGANSRGWLEGK